MLLSELVSKLDLRRGLPADILQAADQIEVSGVTADSRDVRPGYAFVAIPGTKVDGRAFIGAAAKAGASAIFSPKAGAGEKPAHQAVEHPRAQEPTTDALVLTVDKPREILAKAAAALFPQQPEQIAAVTGTNGKTSVAQFTCQMWEHLEIKAASLGTLGVSAPGFEDIPPLTTPDPVALHKGLQRLSQAGYSHLALEASSHGLDQRRLEGMRISAGAFTNLTRDHLDYHHTMENYRAAKLRLFSDLVKTGGLAVANADVPEMRLIREICVDRGLRLLDYGHGAEHLRLLETLPHEAGQEMVFELEGVRHRVDLPLVGSFQAHNVLCALGILLGMSSKGARACGDQSCQDRAVEALAGLKGVRGRMEHVGTRAGGGSVFVDYAHTPDALETALTGLKPHVSGRMIAIFGCGGDRDPGKRPQMGAVVKRLADVAILTDDNPRTENPADIRRDARRGAPNALEIGDRRQAISTGIEMLKPGDVLLVAGKGHESGQDIGSKVLPFDDAAVSRELLGDI